MNIACTVCSARYVVPDDKIAGRRVRITCKRCKALLTVDGSVSPPRVTAGAPTSVAPAPTSSAPPAAELPAPAEPADRRFTVTLTDDTQEQADVAQIVRLYRSGRLPAESLVWRDGMTDWASPWEVPEIADAFRRMGIARPAPASSPGQSSYGGPSGEEEESTRARGSSASDEEPTHVVPSSPLGASAVPNFGGDFDDDETTRVHESSPFTAQIADLRAREQAAEDERPKAPVPAAGRPYTPQPFAAQTPPPGAERRTSSSPPGSQRARREPKFDKRKAQREAAREAQASQFAKQGAAGSEMEALEQAIIEQTRQNNPEGDDGARLTGARNESSVLFSLDALLQREERAEKPRRTERTDESLLVAPASALPHHVAAAPLTAPDFTAPVLAPPPSSVRPPALEVEIANAPPKRSRLTMPLVMVGVLAAGAAGGYLTGAIKPFGAKPAASAVTAEPSTPSAAATQDTPAPAESQAPAASAAPLDSAAVSATGTAAAPAPPATGLGEPAAAPDASATAAAAAPGAAAPAPGTGAKEPSGPSKPASLQDLANAINSSAPPFNTAAAKEALTAASGEAASCAQPGGPTGSGKVAITFAPSGRATSVSVGGAFAGTEVGSCIARKFRGARVPAFSGEPVSVSKSVTIQ
jgi:predicted Zn finger-like uncharacterized protein